MLYTSNTPNWLNRFSGYKKTFAMLSEFINQKELSNIQRLGLIKAFDLSFDLAWNVIKDYYQCQGITGIQGSRDAFRTAFKQSLIKDGETWRSMIESRIQTTHVYNESVARDIAEDIRDNYYDQFKALKHQLEKLEQDLSFLCLIPDLQPENLHARGQAVNSIKI